MISSLSRTYGEAPRSSKICPKSTTGSEFSWTQEQRAFCPDISFTMSRDTCCTSLEKKHVERYEQNPESATSSATHAHRRPSWKMRCVELGNSCRCPQAARFQGGILKNNFILAVQARRLTINRSSLGYSMQAQETLVPD
jgi:hypothetical protein